MDWYLAVLKNYAGFSGRARRTEYWMYTLFNVLIVIALAIVGAIGAAADLPFLAFLYPLYLMAVLIPSLAVTVRRLHDTGKSGWMYFLVIIPLIGPILLLVFLASPSDDVNQYGNAAPRTPVG
ncbi:uncharacterized membrane protein YhaH (DUF805 family) [Stackebrandtia endophytica]|uniref:Uncharacterized membrane protein YhaH (DUF805 family) n=1 Tax=Stackebrandtia endophytica TaxID=1496996 RepID=A0A543AR19_9ACTN|nr:DUF805 domain-containing protein [Stackebrandtia endophytica]TQL75027.1 uncharacterized membrane protein YhaH (DUF805 family) [Stackebrandtia endophytica]